MINEICWLPKQEYFNDYGSWNDYQEALYSIFKHDFLNNFPYFKNVRVSVKHYQKYKDSFVK